MFYLCHTINFVRHLILTYLILLINSGVILPLSAPRQSYWALVK